MARCRTRDPADQRGSTALEREYACLRPRAPRAACFHFTGCGPVYRRAAVAFKNPHGRRRTICRREAVMDVGMSMARRRRSTAPHIVEIGLPENRWPPQTLRPTCQPNPRPLPKPRQMRSAPTAQRPETRDSDFPARQPSMQFALRHRRPRQHKRLDTVGDHQKVIDVPVHPLLATQVPPDPLDKAIPGRAGIHVPAGRKPAQAKPADANRHRSPPPDQQLVCSGDHSHG